MIIFNCKNFMQGAYSIREMYLQGCNVELQYELSIRTPGLTHMLEKYGLNNIKTAINSIYVDKDGNISIPEHNEYSKILRLLEYGGEEVKPTHLLSIVKNRLFNALDMGV